MRAVGYVARPSESEKNSAAISDESFSWESSLVPAAGSWGDYSTLSLTYGPSTRGPAEEIVRYCEGGGHNLTAIFGIDGGTDDLYRSWAVENSALPDEVWQRPPNPFIDEFGDEQFADLIEALAGPNGRPALVVVPDASHLADDLESLVERLLIIRRTGSETVCADYDIPDPLQNGEELLGLRGSPDWLRRKIRSKVMQKASRGEVLGRTPYGYRCNADGNLEPVPDEAEVVESVFKWYVGEKPGSKGIGMRLIAQRLTEQGVPTRSGKPWSATTVSIILKNRVYVGTYSRFGFMVVGNHPQIISRSLFRRAQDTLALKHHKMRRLGSASPFLLGGLLKCGHCGHGVPGMTRKRSWKRKDASVTTKTYRYYEFYECPERRRRKSGRFDEERCPTWRADALDDEVKREISEWPEDVKKRIEPLDLGLSLEERLEQAEKWFLQETAGVSAGRGDLEHLEPSLIELKGLRNAIAQAQNSVDEPSEESNRTRGSSSQNVVKLIADAAESGDPHRARDAMLSLLNEVVVTNEEVCVSPRLKD